MDGLVPAEPFNRTGELAQVSHIAGFVAQESEAEGTHLLVVLQCCYLLISFLRKRFGIAGIRFLCFPLVPADTTHLLVKVPIMLGGGGKLLQQDQTRTFVL